MLSSGIRWPQMQIFDTLLEYFWVRKWPLVILQGVDSLLSLSWLTKKENRDIFVKSWLRLTFSRFSKFFFYDSFFQTRFPFGFNFFNEWVRPTAYFFSNECVYVRLSMNEDANNLLFSRYLSAHTPPSWMFALFLRSFLVKQVEKEIRKLIKWLN